MWTEDNGSSSSDDSSLPDPSPFAQTSLRSSPAPEANISTPTRPSGGNRGLPHCVEEQLLRDIEAFGGIASINLSHICNLKPETYGEPNTQQRKKIQNKVNAWKQLNCRDYKRLLGLYRIISRATTGSNTTAPPAPTEADREHADIPNNFSSKIVQYQPTSPTVPGESTLLASPLQTMISSNAIPIGNIKSASKNMMHMERVLAAEEFVEIEADLTCPERNREVNVFVLTGRKHEGKLHDGISIELLADSRDVTKGLYRAFLIPNGRDVFLKFPGQVASFAMDHRLVALKEGAQFCERLQQSRDLARNAIHQSATRSTKNIILRFPGYMALSNSIYSPSTKDGEIKMITAPYTLDVPLGNKPYPSLLCRIGWRLHIEDSNDRTVDDVDDTGNNFYEDDLVSRLQGIVSPPAGGTVQTRSPAQWSQPTQTSTATRFAHLASQSQPDWPFKNSSTWEHATHNVTNPVQTTNPTGQTTTSHKTSGDPGFADFASPSQPDWPLDNATWEHTTPQPTSLKPSALVFSKGRELQTPRQETDQQTEDGGHLKRLFASFSSTLKNAVELGSNNKQTNEDDINVVFE